METTRYTSHNNIGVLQSIKEVFSSYINGSSLAYRIAKRDIKAQYRQSMLGFAWVLIVPLASALLWVVLQKQGVLNSEGISVPYVVFALTGIILWQLFVESLNSPLNMFKQSKSMLTKINFPREALILAGLYKVLFNLSIKSIILIVLFITYKVSPGELFYMIPLGLFSIILFGFSLGILITPIGVLYNDVQQFLQTFIRLFFFLTPVIYAPAREGVLSLINRYNPIGILLQTTRQWMIGESISFEGFFIVFGLSFLLFILASIIYKISMPIIIERIGS